ncbi:MAG: exonuclease [Desulfobacteraceae bacterium IS3]|nr:MAG: exonuclease [Desulfobacteraceae bacterium IS3]
MGLLSSSVSVTRYKVEGKPAEPVLETIADGLKKNVITEIDNDIAEKSSGWTSFETPFKPDFEGSSFVVGTYLIFSMRIDKKAIPSKIIKKLCDEEIADRLAKTGREHLSRNEKQAIRENVVNSLSLRIPATPCIYDLVWSMEEEWLWFFSNQKAANEELETMFSKSFGLSLVRLFPYSVADLTAGLSDAEHTLLSELSPARFTE